MAYVVLACTALFAVASARSVEHVLRGGHLPLEGMVLTIFTSIVETGASFYAFAFIFSAIAYFWMSDREPRQGQLPSPLPPIGILYLCCGDLDVAALRSLCELRYRGKIHLVVHDDSTSRASQREVDSALADLPAPENFEVHLLRRPAKNGGKAGAVNYAIEKTGHLYPYFLLCDNDSTIVDPAIIDKVLPRFEDSRVAVVQCRCAAVVSDYDSPILRLVSRSIDVFDLFLSVCARFGWRMFIGHNAFLRTEAVQAVGGLTPGFFSDDLDLVVRLNLRGYTVPYARDIVIGEKHPSSHDAFRRRTYKWSYGCMQMLKAHAGTVLTSNRFTFAEKVSFFYFTGFYVGQVILLLYIALRFLVAPFYWSSAWSNIPLSLLTGTVLLGLIYLPTCSYFVKNQRFRGALGSVILCGLVYGTTDFVCAAGVWDCLRGKRRRWVPTNARTEDSRQHAVYWEALFGALLLSIPLIKFPALLYWPCSYLFAGKFLVAPAVSLLYRDQEITAQRPEASEVAA